MTSINGRIDGRGRSAGRWGRCRYIMCMWRAAGAMFAQTHFEMSICDHMPPLPPSSFSLPPFPSSGSPVVLWETIGKVSHFLCRAIAPQLLVSAPLPSLFALSHTCSLSSSRKVSCCHPLASAGNTYPCSVLFSPTLGLIVLPYPYIYQYLTLCLFTCRFLIAVVTIICVILQEFPSSWQPL